MISKLHYITTNAKMAEQACMGGADWIQLRLKNISYRDYKSIALEVLAVCRLYGATLIINDNVMLAADIAAHGVHIGKEDMPPAQAREILGNDYIIGCTANTIDDIIKLSSENIDYLGLGPYRHTTTKENLSPILGLEGFRTIFNTLHKLEIQVPPIVGIGGILVDDAALLVSTGLHGIAVSSAISNAENIVQMMALFREAVK